jgi:serine/threonine-protein kinase
MVPMQLRQFELRSIIGVGGNGKVYRAWDTVLEREVAVKLMKKELVEDELALTNFYREARACASLNHTNIIHIYSFDQSEDGQLYLVMELADHGSLDGKIDKYQRLPELEVLDIGTKIASALDMALKHNLLHRDIKPGNILFNEYGEPKLVDFGLARAAEGDTEYEAAIWGTPYYVAPEKVQRHGETFHSDMYSLGGTLYHALTGHVPFEADTVEEVVAGHVQTPLTPPNQVRPEISPATSDAIYMAMAKEPAQRFVDYQEMITALQAALSHLLVAQHQAQQAGAGESRSGWSLFKRGH